MNRIAQEAHACQRVLEYYLKHRNGTETAIRYKISRKTLYKWLKRYDGTWQSLVERSRRPHSSPRAHTAEEIQQIRRLAKKHQWEDLILAYQEMREKHGYRRSYGRFKRIVAKLKAAKGNKKRKCRKNKPYQRAKYPGQKVQVDVKFVPAECVVDGRKYYQFTAVDECTRWTYRVYPRFCVNSNEAVQNINQLRTSGQRSHPMSDCVHHSMPYGRSQGRREAPFIAAPAGREDP